MTDSKPVTYRDGAEDEVLTALRAVTDLSAGSDQLSARITNYQTEYHFSPQRLPLLLPLELREGLKVADLGCGSGVLTRAIGETGASVLGVEGTEERAAAARLRCHDLPNVKIVAGRADDALAEINDLDLVLLCGLLEWTAVEEDGPARVLAAVEASLGPNGVVAIAIENQLGLGYLAGRHEDHHGRPWIGVADYPSPSQGPRTWGLEALRAMLADHGFAAQRWMSPYPDYKIPRIVLDEAIYARQDAVELVDKLVRDPLAGAFRGSDAAVVCGRRLQRLMVREGLGLVTAPCFLVVAGRTPQAVAQATKPGLAWMASASRRREFRRSRTVLESTIVNIPGTPRAANREWVERVTEEAEALIAGTALDSLLLDALHRGDLARLGDLLARWHAHVRDGSAPATETQPAHPYLPHHPDTDVLPPERGDCHPGNVIVDESGVLHTVDLEWRLAGGVDAELAVVRALFLFAYEVAATGACHPLGSDATVRDLLLYLCDLVGMKATAERRLDEFCDAEAAFQSIVSGNEVSVRRQALRDQLDLRTPRRMWDLDGGLPGVLARSDRAELELAESRAEVATLHQSIARLGAELNDESDRARALVDRNGGLEVKLGGLEVRAKRAEFYNTRNKARLERATRDLAHTRSRVRALETSRSYRLTQKIRNLASKLQRRT